jgi:hypothetical protein
LRLYRGRALNPRKNDVKNDNLILRGNPALIALHRVKDPPRPEIMRAFPAGYRLAVVSEPLKKIPAKDVISAIYVPMTERRCRSGLSGRPIH